MFHPKLNNHINDLRWQYRSWYEKDKLSNNIRTKYIEPESYGEVCKEDKSFFAEGEKMGAERA